MSISLLISSCGKYPEGPGFSLRSKKARVANTWVVEYAEDLEDGEEETDDYQNQELTLTKENEVRFKFGNSFIVEGSWEFKNDKESIRLSFSNSSQTYDLLKLKNKEMWWEGDDDEIHWVEK
jgi:hypothetical protein